MADTISVRAELGPKFTLQGTDNSTKFTIAVGTKSSSGSSSSGESSPTSDVQITAAQALSLFRAVTINGLYCEPTLDSLSNYAGVTKTALVLGQVAKVAKSGILTELTWTWTPNQPIFVGASGVLTQTVTALPVRRIGWAVSPTQINLDPYPVIGV